MSFVAINVLTVPPEMRETLEQRFAKRAGEVDGMDGFEDFQLLRPESGQDRYFVLTRWRDEASFKAWTESQEFNRGHAQHSSSGPAASGSEVWTFTVAESSPGT
ncbi:antibiotic biosynthesis monooxygenase [Thermoleophilia bacterium SCSIO 60948]|nr:antibiotic biosynthesis monooxygenase [Thermoleophilia bacterium SCSIO 60948]